MKYKFVKNVTSPIDQLNTFVLGVTHNNTAAGKSCDATEIASSSMVRDVRLSMKTVGLCGSDTYMYKNASHGSHPITEPTPVGHEASGVVAESIVVLLKMNHPAPRTQKSQIHICKAVLGRDRVALEPGAACHKCKSCLRGQPSVCLVEQTYLGRGLEVGYIRREHVMKADYCHRLPAEISDEEGAFMEPLAVAVHDCRRGEVGAGKSVLILGADIIESRLKLAKELGATHTLLTTSRDLESIAKQIHDVMGEMPDVTLECSANNFCLRIAVAATVPSGCVVLVGYGEHECTFPIAEVVEKQIDLRPCFRYDRYPIAIDLIKYGRLNVKPLITHRFPLKSTSAAMEKSASREPDIIESRLKLAKELGATHTLLTSSRDLESIAKQIHDVMGEMPDVTLECSANNFCLRIAVAATVPSGCVVLVGYGEHECTFPIVEVVEKQIDLRPMVDVREVSGLAA
ncbi:DHSO-like protein [Mya arenaria]|uniref:DHSO-like protein n=1 Tax=Mya arenaria TaxID=6604 RepID=A0ABY7DBM0_MYAAR|nr:DHSO-like protein [Mya arenaria]